MFYALRKHFYEDLNMATTISLTEIIEDLQGIEPKILEYEKKYQLLSTYFYKLYPD